MTTSKTDKTEPDWQVSIVLSDTIFVEIDCNSGRKRMLEKSKCECGEAILIQRNAGEGFRTDGKRIFYPNSKDEHSCIFRCRSCRKPIDRTAPGAEFE